MPLAPRALRVATLRDRLVLHDTTHFLRRRDPCARNALIDAANAASRAQAAASSARANALVDIGGDGDEEDEPSGVRGYLVLPFDGGQVYETRSAREAGLADGGGGAAIEAAAGFLGIMRLCSAAYAFVASHIRTGGSLPFGEVITVHRVKMLKLGGGPASKLDRDFCGAVAKLLESGALYYSPDCDLTHSLEKSGGGGGESGNAFWWTWPMAKGGGPCAASWALKTVYGYVGTEEMRFATGRGVEAVSGGFGAEASLPRPVSSPGGRDFLLTLISRRSRRRAGTRFITRGVDGMGDVANFVETEQVVWAPDRPDVYSAFTVIRGSVPVFWRQNNGIARPSPELDSTLTASREAFSMHFRNIVRSYGGIVAVSLVDLHGSESVLADAFVRHFELDVKGAFDEQVTPTLVAFDFHKHCGGKDYERGLAMLMSELQDKLETFGFFTAGVNGVPGIPTHQKGVFRVNCVDCLDRTNVVQSLLARVALDRQLRAVFHADIPAQSDPSVGVGGKPKLFHESEDRFKHVWGDNADSVSKQYSGTGALKTDFTRTGKRSTQGMLGDGVKSVVRMYYKNFVDEGRQEAIDIMCGYANVRPRSLDAAGGANSPANSNLVVAPGQDLLEEYVLPSPSFSSMTNIQTEATRDPRASEVGVVGGIPASSSDSPLWHSFSALRMNGGGDKQQVLVELRDDVMLLATQEGVNFEFPRRGVALWDKCEDAKMGDRKSPSRIRLIFKPSTGSPAASSPLDLLFRGGPTARETFTRAFLSWAQPAVMGGLNAPVRLRVLSARGVSKHCMADWGLDGDVSSREVVALVVPEGHSDTRELGLAAVPLDVDSSNYVLVSAQAVSSRGPAIAVLASKKAAPTVMSVSESLVGRAGSLTGGGAVAVSLVVSGTSVCFVSARLGGAKDLFRVLSSLKLRRPMFDVTNQFEHFYIAGVMGDLQWRNGDVPDDGPAARQFLTLGDGAKSYSLGNGLSVMRNSFPELAITDMLDESSYWRHRKQYSKVSSEASPTRPHADGASGPFPGSSAHRSVESKTSATESRKFARADSGPALCVALIDEVVQGRPAPLLPETLSRCVVTISELSGEGIKMPPGIDQSTPLNTFVAFYSDYVGPEAVITRPTGRPTSSPDWREDIRMVFVPSDAEDVKTGFLLGQVLIPVPLADPIPAGHCVLPISYALNGGAEFDIPLRLAGIATGRLRGVIELEYRPVDAEGSVASAGDWAAAEDIPGERFGRDSESFGSGSAHRANSVSSASRAAGLPMPSTGLSSLQSASAPNIDELNEKFDVARRKGSKQIKSMVGKLSSFLGQGSSVGGVVGVDGVGPAGSSFPSFASSSSHGASRSGGTDAPPFSKETVLSAARERNTSEVESEFGAFESAVSPSASGDSPPKRQQPLSQASSVPRPPGSSRASSRSGIAPPIARSGPDPLLTGLKTNSSAKSGDDLGKLKNESALSTDVLFQSLTRNDSRPGAVSGGTEVAAPRVAPLAKSGVIAGADDLLAGLRATQLLGGAGAVPSVLPAVEVGGGEDDFWGGFEDGGSMSPPPPGDGVRKGNGSESKTEKSLLDL